MFEQFFSDIKGFVGSDFWENAVKLAGPTVSEVLKGNKSTASGGKSTPAFDVSKYDMNITGNPNISDRSGSSKSFAPEAVDANEIVQEQAARREAFIVRMKSYADGTL